ncbi:unnamed protein product, partial [Ectocarpus sp. 8 AP-2014]
PLNPTTILHSRYPYSFRSTMSERRNRSSQTDVATPIVVKSTEGGMHNLENHHRIRSVPTLPTEDRSLRKKRNPKARKTKHRYDRGGTGGDGRRTGRMLPSAHSASLNFSYLISL